MALLDFSVALGPQRMCELIQASPSRHLLLPLKTALEREIGLEPRVALEVDEVCSGHPAGSGSTASEPNVSVERREE